MTDSNQKPVIIQQDKFYSFYCASKVILKLSSEPRGGEQASNVKEYTCIFFDKEESLRALEKCDDTGRFGLEGFVGGAEDSSEITIGHIRKKLAKQSRKLAAYGVVEDVIYSPVSRGEDVSLSFENYVKLGRVDVIKIKSTREIVQGKFIK
jgi:hypothetical protein